MTINYDSSELTYDDPGYRYDGFNDVLPPIRPKYWLGGSNGKRKKKNLFPDFLNVTVCALPIGINGSSLTFDIECQPIEYTDTTDDFVVKSQIEAVSLIEPEFVINSGVLSTEILAQPTVTASIIDTDKVYAEAVIVAKAQGIDEEYSIESRLEEEEEEEFEYTLACSPLLIDDSEEPIFKVKLVHIDERTKTTKNES